MYNISPNADTCYYCEAGKYSDPGTVIIIIVIIIIIIIIIRINVMY